jgi:tetratricopeptide (TPR) repeat protein
LTRTNFLFFFFVLLLIDVHRHLLYRHFLYRRFLYCHCLTSQSTRPSLDLRSPTADTTTTTPTITTATVSTETYGELHTDSVYTLLETCTSINNTKGSDLSFLDLGSGHGKVVLLSSLFCGKSNGIESVQCRHKVAIQISQEFIQRVHPLMPSDQSLCIPTFSCGDMFEMSWSDHTIIYACSTCFDTNMMVEIAKKSAMELDNNAILCTVTHCLPANVIASTRLIEIKTITLQFTWGEEIVYMYQQQEQQQEQDQEQDQEQHKQHKKHEKHEEKESKESKEQKTSTDKLVMSEADKYNKAGSLLQNLGVYEKAIQQYRSALKKDKFHASSHFNMATCLCHLADKSEGSNIAIAFRRKARSHYIKASESSSNGFGEAHSNLAVLYLKENMLDEALASVEVALNLHDIGTMSYNKAFWNLSSVLRRLGQKDIAIERAWTTIEAASVILSSSTTDSIKEHNDATNNRFVRPTRIQCIDYTTSLSATSSTSTSPASKTSSSTIPPTTTTLSKIITLSIICVKWGTKYGPEYVLRLYAGVLRNLSLPFKFVCFTDDTVGLEHENNIHCLPLESGWIGWWNKATLFSSSFPLDGRILYIDLDTVITGSMNEMAMYRGDFAILSTNGIDNEGKDFSNGYNSSILMWNANNKKLTSICEVLRQDFELVHKFIHRFDHWLEMMVNKADLIQQIYPLSIRDYVNACTEFVPEKCSIVIFPLRPKPHEFPAEWVKEIWCQDEK